MTSILFVTQTVSNSQAAVKICRHIHSCASLSFKVIHVYLPRHAIMRNLRPSLLARMSVNQSRQAIASSNRVNQSRQAIASSNRVKQSRHLRVEVDKKRAFAYEQAHISALTSIFIKSRVQIYLHRHVHTRSTDRQTYIHTRMQTLCGQPNTDTPYINTDRQTIHSVSGDSFTRE